MATNDIGIAIDSQAPMLWYMTACIINADYDQFTKEWSENPGVNWYSSFDGYWQMWSSIRDLKRLKITLDHCWHMGMIGCYEY